ncbi:MAG: hypothetical protein M0D54_20330 [Hyphomonadaceae bacterium JAD_PAG50586_4]|nr:MAG: hypothetical protein M0D54_20330 [Hyphomonadaceae bacterium JAD_PAG50586_4]
MECRRYRRQTWKKRECIIQARRSETGGRLCACLQRGLKAPALDSVALGDDVVNLARVGVAAPGAKVRDVNLAEAEWYFEVLRERNWDELLGLVGAVGLIAHEA